MYKDSILTDNYLLTRFDERITYVKRLGSITNPVYEVEVKERENGNVVRIFVNPNQFVRWKIPSNWSVGNSVKFKKSQDDNHLKKGVIHSLKPFQIEYFHHGEFNEPEILSDIHPYNVTKVIPIKDEDVKEQANCQFEILKETLERILVKGNIFPEEKIKFHYDNEANHFEWQNLSICPTTIELKTILGIKETVGWQINRVNSGKDYYDVNISIIFIGLLQDATKKFVELIAQTLIENEFDQYSTECLAKAYMEEKALDFSTIRG
jgi:hypothetical protein